MNARIEKAELSRRAVLENSHGKSGDVFANPDGVTIIEQTLPNDLRIPVDKLNAPLDYTVPPPTEPEEEGDGIEVNIRKVGSIPWESMEPAFELGPIAARTWPLPLEIPVKYLVEEDAPEAPTEYEIQYLYYYNGINPGYSDLTTYAIDRTPPYKVKPDTDLSPGAASWPADLGPNVIIDQDYIDSHPGGITITVASYDLYYDATDYVRVYWGVNPDPDRDQPVFEGTLDSSYQIIIPISVFENSVEDRNALIYQVTDLAGNKSKASNRSYRYVKFTDPPTAFDPPVLPLANGDDGDDLIDLADCDLGVDIVVTVPTPNLLSDTIIAYWGTVSLDEKSVSSQNANGELIWEDVDFSIIESAYGNTDGDKPVNISYKMFRNTGSTPLGGSDVTIDVNIFTIGPPNPDKPSPINTALSEAYLTTSAGSNNEVLETDYGDNNVEITIPIFDSPPTQEGWLIDVFYDDVKVGDTILLTDGLEGTGITRPLPWQTIYDQQSGIKELRWVLYTEDNPNPVKSPSQDITVAPFPIELAEPEVLDLAGINKNLIACATLNFPTADGTARHNLRVLIPKSPYTVDGETITLSWEAYTGDSPPVLIPGTEVTESLLISGTYPDAGEVIEIGDYNTHFLPADKAYGRLSYTITRTGMADTPPSLEAEHYVFLINGSGQYCHEVTYPTP